MQTAVFPLDLESDAGKKWLESVSKALRGKDFQTLRSETLDGQVLEPLYSCTQNVSAVSARPAGHPWQIVHRLSSRNLQDANLEIRSAVSNGSDCIDIVLPTAPADFESAVEIRTLEDIGKLFDEVDLSSLAVRITGGMESAAIYAGILEHSKKIGIDSSKLDIAQAFDLTLNMSGSATKEQAQFRARHLTDQLKAMEGLGDGSRIFAIDSRLWHNAGANNFLELALCLSQLVESIRICEDAGISPQQFSQRFSVILSADSDQFANVAKFRAVRILLNQALSHCNAETEHFPVHAESSWRMMTVHDPWVNLLRTTLACFSAGIAGADSITILPHTFATGAVNELSLRLARNTQSILQEESYLTKVADPAAGSGIIEELTDSFCAHAWKAFQSIEGQGGLISAIESGHVESLINVPEESRRNNISVGKTPITGVSTFPNIEDHTIKPDSGNRKSSSDEGFDESLPAPSNGEWFNAIGQKISETGKIPILLDQFANQSNTNQFKCRRLSEPFEELRDMASKLEKQGNPPAIFLAGLGPLSSFLPAANFAKNFFEAAGIRTSQNMAQQSASELINSFADSKSQIVCLCANQSGYAEFGKEMIESLKNAGAKKIYAVGRFADNESVFADSDIEEWVFSGCDMLNILTKALKSFA